MKILRKTWLAAIALLFVSEVRAQSADSLEGIRVFLKASNSYKQLPLQIDLQMDKSVNLLTNSQDTLHVDARFCMLEDESYVSFGELEQVVNDSLLLVVNNKLKKMILYPNHRSVSGQLKQYLGIQLSDSSITGIDKKYLAAITPGQNQKSVVELKTRAVLSPAKLAKEEIRISYETGTYEPSEVVQTHRRWLAVSAEDYLRYSIRPDFADKRYQSEDGRYYLIREQVTTYRYRHIGHDRTNKPPAAIADRLGRGPDGRYSPVNRYADFSLSQQL